MYEEKGTVYNAVLGLVDIVRGTNSYYKLQLLEGDAAKNYCVFRAWGRVGTSVGNNKLEVSISITIVTLKCFHHHVTLKYFHHHSDTSVFPSL